MALISLCYESVWGWCWNIIVWSVVSVTDKLVPSDGEAKVERAAVSGKQRSETIRRAAEGIVLCPNS